MAGTRLLVHTSFLVQLVVWTLVAFYFGLCVEDDWVCRRGRRWWTTLVSSSSSLDMPLPDDLSEFRPISIVTSDSQVVFWQSALHKLKLSDDLVRVVPDTDGTLSQVCRLEEAALSSSSSSNLWVCENMIAPLQPKMVIKNQNAILYPRNIEQRMKDFTAMYPTTTAKLPSTLDIVLWTDTKDWSINEYEQELVNLPCVKQVKRTFKYQDFQLRPTLQEDNSTVYYIENLSKFESHRDDEAATIITVLRPSLQPARFRGSGEVTSTLAQQGRDWFVLDGEDTAAATSARLESRFLSQCLGMEGIFKDFVVESDGSVPLFYTNLYLQRTLRRSYRDVVERAKREREYLTQVSHRVVISREMLDQWKQVVDALKDAREACREGRLFLAQQLIDLSVSPLNVLSRDPSLAEPLDFPLEQHAAIFAPLLLPLLLPLLTGLIRETKRYRMLRKKAMDGKDDVDLGTTSTAESKNK